MARLADGLMTWGANVSIALLLPSWRKLPSPFTPGLMSEVAEAVQRHGVLSGSWLAAKRVARCHPFCAGGHDPVPPRS
jgi:putative membrane protein insertion efficiency factor